MTEKVLFTKKGPGALAPDPSLMFFLCFMPFRERSSLNRDGLFRLNFFCVLLRDAQFQDTILKFRLDVFLCHSVAYIEASLHCAGITLLADVFAFLILLIFIQAFRSGNGQVTVLKFDVDLIFLESRQINVKFISCMISVFMIFFAFLPYSGFFLPQKSLSKSNQSSSNKFSPKILGINISHYSFHY